MNPWIEAIKASTAKLETVESTLSANSAILSRDLNELRDESAETRKEVTSLKGMVTVMQDQLTMSKAPKAEKRIPWGYIAAGVGAGLVVGAVGYHCFK